MQSSLIASRVTGGFVALLAVLVICFLASVRGASRLAEADAAVARARAVLEEITAARTTLREAESARRGYLLTHDRAFLDLYVAATKDAGTRLDRLRELTGDDPAQRRRVDAVAPLTARQLTLVTDAIAATPEAARASAAAPPDDGAVVAEQIRGLVGELETAARARVRKREADADARTMRVIRGFGAVAMIALLLLGATSYVLDRDAAVHAAVLDELRMYTGTAKSAATAAATPPPPTRTDVDVPPD